MQKKKPMPLKESIIQEKVSDYFKQRGWFGYKIIQTTKNGIPDLIFHKKGRTIYIETKAENGIVSPLQFYRHEELMKQDIEVYIIYSLNDLHNVKIS
jgi:hypothetical protein